MSTKIDNYCIDCKQVASPDCDARGHIVGTLGQNPEPQKQVRGDYDHCAYVHEHLGMRCGGYRRGHESRYVDHPFMESRGSATPQISAAAFDQQYRGDFEASHRAKYPQSVLADLLDAGEISRQQYERLRLQSVDSEKQEIQ